MMLTVAQAFEHLLATVAPCELSEVPLEHSLGLCLGRDVTSPCDSPPFDKSAMDGYAVRSGDLANGSAVLRVVEVITAGRVPSRTIATGEAAQIMTGAPLPTGADLVIKVEETQRNGDLVLIATEHGKAESNVIRRGTSVQKGDRVLSAGLTLNGSRIGALAELGQSTVLVRRRPRVAILATGDELVPVGDVPGPGQIRNSNAVMLAAQIESAGGIVISLGIARDDRDDLFTKIQQGLQSDLFVLSGGVSAGTLDLIPSLLQEAGVKEVFHKVEMKPGKPIWFGIRAPVPQTDSKICLVFGLPGNPVGSLVCCELFVRTAIRGFMGIEPATPQSISAILEHEHTTYLDRPIYHPATLVWRDQQPMVSLVKWHGSADLCGTVAANAMVLLPSKARCYQVGDRVETLLW